MAFDKPASELIGMSAYDFAELDMIQREQALKSMLLKRYYITIKTTKNQYSEDKSFVILQIRPYEEIRSLKLYLHYLTKSIN